MPPWPVFPEQKRMPRGGSRPFGGRGFRLGEGADDLPNQEAPCEEVEAIFETGPPFEDAFDRVLRVVGEALQEAVERLEKCRMVCGAWAEKLATVAGAKPLRIEISDYICAVTMKISAFDSPRSSSSHNRDHDKELRDIRRSVTVLEHHFGELRKKVNPLIGDISHIPTRISKKRPNHMISEGDHGLPEETQEEATLEPEPQETTLEPETQEETQEETQIGDLSQMFDVD
jgi:hypothetical protein